MLESSVARKGVGREGNRFSLGIRERDDDEAAQRGNSSHSRDTFFFALAKKCHTLQDAGALHTIGG